MLRIFALGFLLSSAAVSAMALTEALGHRPMTLSPAFESYLDENPEVKKQLIANQSLLRLVVNSTYIQNQLIAGRTTLPALTTSFLGGTQKAKAAIRPEPTSLNNAPVVTAGHDKESLPIEDVAHEAAQEATAPDRPKTPLAVVIETEAETEGEIKQAPVVHDSLPVFSREDIEHILAGEKTLDEVAQHRGLDTTAEPPVISATHAVGTAPVMAEAPLDFNAIPPRNGLDDLDANGWPKYLNVPADCPAAQREDVEYLHHIRQYVSNNGTEQAIRRTPYGSALTLYQNEVIAKPIVTTQKIGAGPEVTWIPPNAALNRGISEIPYQFSFAYCPGDFLGTTPQDEVALSEKCTFTLMGSGVRRGAIHVRGTAAYDEAASRNNMCILEPGKAYFINIRSDKLREPSRYTLRPVPVAYTDADYGYADMIARGFVERVASYRAENYRLNAKETSKGRVFRQAQTLYVEGVMSHQAPYTNVCLQEAPYPINYDGGTCGEQRAGGDTGALHYACYDITGQQQAQLFTREHHNGQLTWTAGYRAPSYSGYQCEFSYVGLQHVEPHQKVCAAHNVGQSRTLSNGVQECVMDEVLGRYAWK